MSWIKEGPAVNALNFLDELASVGIRLTRDDRDLIVDIAPGSSIEPFRDRIAEMKSALVRELLQREIVAAATVKIDQFDRQSYDELVELWNALVGEAGR
jgi:hypothetical protein